MNTASPPLNRELLSQSWKAWITNDHRDAPGPWWLPWLWTLLFCAGIALFFTVLGMVFTAPTAAAWAKGSLWITWLGRNFVIALTIGVVIYVLFDITRRWFATPQAIGAWPNWQRTVYFTGVPLFGVLVGWPLGVALIGGNLQQLWSTEEGRQMLAVSLFVALAFTYALHLYFSARARELEAQRRAA